MYYISVLYCVCTEVCQSYKSVGYITYLLCTLFYYIANNKGRLRECLVFHYISRETHFCVGYDDILILFFEALCSAACI